MSNRSSSKKYGLGIVLMIFSFVTIFGSVAFVQPAKAQFGVSILQDTPRMVGELATKIKEGLKVAVIKAAQSAVSYALRKIAHDTAVYLASGGKGQSPFAHTTGFSDYMGNVASDAFGTAIDELGKPFGLNLCGVPDIKIDFAIKIGLRARFDEGGPVQPTCNFAKFKKGWGADAWQSKYGSKDALQKQFNASLTADPQSDMGIYLKSTQKIDNIVSKKTDALKAEREEGQGFKGMTSLISGDIKTPAQAEKKSLEENAPEAQNKKSEDQIGAAIGSGSFQVIPATLSMFLNTLASTMLKNFREKGMLPFGVCIGEYGADYCKNTGKDNVAIFEGAGVKIGGRAAAQAAFSEFLVANIRAQDNYDILAQLENCPDAPGLYNCRADGGLVQAVQEAKYDKPITIAEALKQTWLHPEWRLLSDERPENLDVNCRESAYCYANIKVLRQVRILPLGFEIAALNSDPDNPWTLGDVVAGFNKCNPNGNYDPVNFPFCHLIDPNWVLKVEPTRCNALVNSAQPLMSGAPDRLEDCVDLSSCVAYNKDGTCLSYGYCAREKNVWRFEADKCDAQFNTCKAFTDANGQSAAYLYRTLDTTYCNQNTAGCLAYSLNQDASGKWLDPAYNGSSPYYNNGIHFNNKISSSCGSNSMGCSAFKVASTTDVLFLRKAPDYLKCYDANPATAAIEWPKNNADVAKMLPKADCSLYSKVCTELEVGCNLFTSILTGEQIPGKFKPAEFSRGTLTTWNDQCDSRCDGYAAYREMPNNYSNGNAVAYIIPSSGRTCKAEEEGCSSFTNMGEVVAGGEKVEYYSYLRPCIKPDTTKQKNFYTYEGNKDGGYQLKVYTLEKDVDGSPKYWYKISSDLADYEKKCNASGVNYKAGLADADCRQFNDDAGNVYYKLLSKTVVVNSSCTYYRFNSAELASSTPANPTCFQNGVYQDGFCYYYGLPSGIQTTAGASRTCSASVNSCFAYKGNVANNVKQIFRDDFEGRDQTPASTGWSVGGSDQLIISTESTHFGEHSLGYTGTAVAGLEKNLGTLVVGRSYVLTFWAKGNKSNTEVKLAADTRENAVGAFNTSDVWQYYSFNPVELDGGTTTVRLLFKGGSGSNLFLDNVRLMEVTDYLYRVRNTLKVDPVCDSNLNDNLPGEALGCSEYTVPNQPNPFFLTNFSYLCRNGAIGCTAMLDTYNTLTNEKPEAYNVWLASTTPGNKTIKISGNSFTCSVPVGATGCYVDVPGYTTSTIIANGGQFVTSSVYIPADTPSTSPIYLVANQESTCNQADLGCTFAGAQAITLTTTVFSTVTVKNDPALYKDNLCQSEAVGCNAYSLGEGSYYFKDPVVVGQRVCEYRSGVTVGTVLSSGWFLKNTTSTPCYPNYIQAGNNYGLWSFGDKNTYQNYVGECPTTQSGCTEFVDNNDKKVRTGNGQPYYFINNSKISEDDCGGLISQKSGCILFDQTDKPGKLWDTQASYLKSDKNNSEKVSPVDTGTKDANVIIKVIRDRECGEWLQGRDLQRSWDEANGEWKANSVGTIGRCNKVPETIQDYDKSNCANFTNDSAQYYGQLLTSELYQARDTAWKGMDFSGYSLLGMYQPDELDQFNIASPGTSLDMRLVKYITCGTGVNCALPGNKITDASCKVGVAAGVSCGKNDSGKCYNGFCIQNHLGTNDFFGVGANNNKENKLKAICRAYPEKTSPFPFTSSIDQTNLFSGVNVCNETASPVVSSDKNADACDCSYTKVTYGDDSFIKYFNYDVPNQNASVLGSVRGDIPAGICQGGEKSNQNCYQDTDCTGGICQKKARVNKLLGWRGYCLEKDYARSINSDKSQFGCLTWLPVDTISGYADINNQYTSAGFIPNQTDKGVFGEYYCLMAKGNRLSYGNNFYETQIAGGELAHPGDDKNDREKATFEDSVLPEIYQDELDYIRVVAKTKSNDWFLIQALGPAADTDKSYYIRNGLITRAVGSELETSNFNRWEISLPIGSMTEKIIDSWSGQGNVPTGVLNNEIFGWGDATKAQYYSNGATDVWVLRYDDGGGDGADDTNDYNFANPLAGDKFRDLLYNGGADCKFEGTSVDPLQDCTEDHDNNDDGCAVGIYFNASSKKLTRIRVACHTGAANNQEYVEYKIIAGLREQCSYIAKTIKENGETVGDTQRLWERSGLTPIAVLESYKFANPQKAPFGSLGLDGAFSTSSLVSLFSRIPEAPYYIDVDKQPTGYNVILPIPKVGAPYSCQGGDCFAFDTAGNINIEQSWPHQQSDNLVQGKLNLSAIFPVLPEIWSWDYTTQRYNNIPTAGTVYAVNNTEFWGDKSHVPQVHPVGSVCNSENGCIEISQEGLTINGKYSEDAIINSSPARAVMQFYAFADSSQMPIRYVSIDWGENGIPTLQPSIGYYRNTRGYFNGQCDLDAKVCYDPSNVSNPVMYDDRPCIKDAECEFLPRCVPENQAKSFGNIIDKTCNSVPVPYEHVYDCVKDGANWDPTCDNNTNMVSRYGGCCVFKPKVQIKDNWGWYNGICKGDPGGDGCYNGYNINKSDEGIDQNKQPWTYFGGTSSSPINVLVAPRK